MRYKYSKRFTLVELLVVIAIIGILVSLLLPGLQKAKSKSIQAVCASQQKQIGVAWYMYWTDNNGKFTPERNGWEAPKYYNEDKHVATQWTVYQVYLDSYTDHKEVYRCPEPTRASSHRNDSDYFQHDYSLPGFVRLNQHEIDESSETALGVDAAWMGIPFWAQRRLEARHLKAANVLWVDGHVSGKSASAIGSNPAWFTRYSRYNGWTGIYEETKLGEWSAGGPVSIPEVN